jgi:hypothetical protein
MCREPSIPENELLGMIWVLFLHLITSKPTVALSAYSYRNQISANLPICGIVWQDGDLSGILPKSLSAWRNLQESYGQPKE